MSVMNDIIVDVLSICPGSKVGDAGLQTQKRKARSAEMTPPELKTMERKKAGRTASKQSRSKSRARNKAYNFSALDDEGDFVQDTEKKMMYKSSQDDASKSSAGGGAVKKPTGGTAGRKKKN